MARPRSRARAQTSIYETTRDDPELERALESRESMKERLGEAKQNFQVHDDIVQALVSKLELGHDAAIRVGRFVISSKQTKGHTVREFEVASKMRVRIKPLKEQ